MRKTGIYKITNLINGKVYIGLSTNIQKRWNKHRCVYYNPNYPEYDYPLYRAVRKYGIENFKFEILEECSKSNLSNREKFFIAQYRADDPRFGYNQDEGGCDPHGTRINKETAALIIDRLSNSNMSFLDIGCEFDISTRMITGINSGEY